MFKKPLLRSCQTVLNYSKPIAMKNMIYAYNQIFVSRRERFDVVQHTSLLGLYPEEGRHRPKNVDSSINNVGKINTGPKFKFQRLVLVFNICTMT